MGMKLYSQLATLDRINFNLWGDGVAKTVSFSLEDAPFALPIKGNPPAAVRELTAQVVVDGAVDPSYELQVSLHRGVVTVTANKPLPPGNALNVGNFDVTLLYDGI